MQVHLQAEAYCPFPVIKDFVDAPLWQVLGSSEHRRSLESLVPHDAALVVIRKDPGGFLGCSVRVQLPLDPYHLVDGQRTAASSGIPGVVPSGFDQATTLGSGPVRFQIFADDSWLVPGVHGRPVATRSFLPWPENWVESVESDKKGAAARKKKKKQDKFAQMRPRMALHQMVPFLDEVFVDYPAVAGSGPMARKRHTGVLAVAVQQLSDELAAREEEEACCGDQCCEEKCCFVSNESCCVNSDSKSNPFKDQRDMEMRRSRDSAAADMKQQRRRNLSKVGGCTDRVLPFSFVRYNNGERTRKFARQLSIIQRPQRRSWERGRPQAPSKRPPRDRRARRSIC
jgi:hypothetical protein